MKTAPRKQEETWPPTPEKEMRREERVFLLKAFAAGILASALEDAEELCQGIRVKARPVRFYGDTCSPARILSELEEFRHSAGRLLRHVDVNPTQYARALDRRLEELRGLVKTLRAP